MPGQEVPLLKVLGVGGVVGVRLAAVPHGLRVVSSLRRERRDQLGLELPGVLPQERRKALDPVGIPPPLPRALIVLRQRPHDLDRPRVLRDHHLALGAVDVVARVDVLRTLRSHCRRGRRRRRRRLGEAVDAAALWEAVPPCSWQQVPAAAHRTAAPGCRAARCASRAWGRGTSARRRTASSRSPGGSDSPITAPAMP